MTTKGTAHTGKTLCLIGLSLCAVFFVSCARTTGQVAFASALARVDDLAAHGHEARALLKIAGLRSKADSASQWLSLAKRERALGRYDRAAITLRKALVRIPASETLTAVLLDTLVAAGDFSETESLAGALAASPYAPIAALAEMRRTAENPLSLNPAYSEIAWEATGDPAFRRNAAVLYAMRGDFAKACSEQSSGDRSGDPMDVGPALPPLPDEAYFTALLCYDAGFPDRSLLYLPADNPALRSSRELALMADAAWRLADSGLARRLWQASCLIHRGSSPLPLYNLAVTARDRGDERVFLETCVGLFPDWYPAVARMVRSVPVNDGTEPADAAEETLRRGGFRTLAMEEADRLRPTLESDALSALDAAIVASGKSASGMDVRFPLEKSRFEERRHPDSVRSSSMMWKLLEQYPGNGVLEGYALWYFASIGNFDACFSLNESLGDSALPFYAGISAAASGDGGRALEAFAACADDALQAWAALANTASIHAALGDDTSAAEEYSRAAAIAPDDKTRSRLHYEASRVLLRLHSEDRARTLLGYAIELDSSNYLAYALLRELEALQ